MAKRKPNNPLQTLIRRLPAPLRNRYFLASVLFVGYMIFFDRHDILTQIQLRNAVHKLEADKEYYEEKINEAQEERLDMELNEERFAREKYFMQRNDEDVFIIVDENENEE
jgi:hypothetical protein